MKKKRTIVVALLTLLGSCSLVAQTNHVTLELVGGESIEFILCQQPSFVYGDKTVTFTTTDTSVEYEMKEIAKLWLGDVSNGIQAVTIDAVKPQFSNSNGEMKFSGFAPNSKVYICNMSGSIVDTYTIPADGNLSVSSLSLPKGAYIVKSNSITYKIIKK